MQHESRHSWSTTRCRPGRKDERRTESRDVEPAVRLQATADATFDANFAHGNRLHNDDQIRRILHARQWGP